MKTSQAELLTEDSVPYDVRIISDGKTKHMWGRFGLRKETELAGQLEKNHIPVLAGAGTGVAAKILAEKKDRPLLILDNEPEILKATGLRSELRKFPNVIWITTSSPLNAARHILELEENFGQKIQLLKIPFYLRLSDFYIQVETILQKESEEKPEFPSWPKFRSPVPRILLLTSQYF